MRDYTIEVEDSLNKIYGGNLAKKFGFESLSGFSSTEGNLDFIPA